jgi:excisionase family DNA binding protein
MNVVSRTRQEEIDMDAITAPVTEFTRLSGISRARIYEMLSAGQLEAVSIGRRRLIKIDSYRRLIESAEHIPAPQRSKTV